jgi:hypothetical protein
MNKTIVDLTHLGGDSDNAIPSCSEWWDAGWLRCHKLHIGMDMKIPHAKFMKIVLRSAKACNRVDDEIHAAQMKNKP